MMSHITVYLKIAFIVYLDNFFIILHWHELDKLC